MKKKETPRILPNDVNSEQAVLGCAFISPEATHLIFEELVADDFYTTSHKKIFEAMLKNYRENIPIDYITLNRRLEQDGTLGEVGGVSYIVTLTNFVPSAANVSHYIEIIRNNSVLRQLIEAGQSIITEAFEHQNAEGTLQLAEKTITDISSKGQKSSLIHIGESLTEVISRMEKMSVDKNAYRGLRTGFKRFDAITNGLQKSDLVLIAARPGVGKTALAMNFCINAAQLNNATVAIFSLEMPNRQLASRSISSIGFVPLQEVISGTDSQNSWDSVFEAKDKLNKTKIYVDDSARTTPYELLSKCRRLKREKGLDLVMIDYLQLMTLGINAKKENRQLEISEITRTLKIAARELDVPIILLSQLSRAIESRTDKRPMLSDLRESGAIEQDADIVMFISKKMPEEGEIEGDEVDCDLVIAKHRNGEIGNIPLKWVGKIVSFYEDNNKDRYKKHITEKENPKDIKLEKIEDNSIDEVF